MRLTSDGSALRGVVADRTPWSIHIERCADWPPLFGVVEKKERGSAAASWGASSGRKWPA